MEHRTDSRRQDVPDGQGRGRTLRARLTQGQVARLYDRLAGLYDVWGRLTETRARRQALTWAGVRNNTRVLEVAVGTGLAFLPVVRANPGGASLGIDISAGMLGRAESRLRKSGCEHYGLCVATALAIPAADAAFDILLNSYMFDLLDERDWPAVLAEFHRVLRPGGRLVLTNMTQGERPGSGIYQRLFTLSPRLMGGCRAVRLTEPLRAAGFAVQRREYIQQLLFPSEVILADRVG
jgi:ubiquinone/menaquinone biosynthesis C-methylase UbiE